MTETKTRTHLTGKQQNRDDVLETSEVDDAIDGTHEDKNLKPPAVVVRRNIY